MKKDDTCNKCGHNMSKHEKSTFEQILDVSCLECNCMEVYLNHLGLGWMKMRK